MIRKFSKKSKLIAASSVLLFATAFMPGTCNITVDQALIDQLTGLLNNSNFSGYFSTGGPGGGNHDGPNHDGLDDGPDSSTGSGVVDATSTGV